MFDTHVLFIITGIFGAFLMATLVGLWVVARRSHRTMDSIMTLITRPERARIHDAARVLNAILADEITKIQSNFQTISDTLREQIATAERLTNELKSHDERLSLTADDTTRKLSQMSQRLDNTMAGLNGIVSSQTWTDVGDSAERFTTNINELMEKVDTTSQNISDRTTVIQEHIDSWSASSKELVGQLETVFNRNTEQMKSISNESDTMQQRLAALSQTTADGFGNIKNSATDYAASLTSNDKLMNDYLTKLDAFSKQAKKQLDAQVNTLTSTANVIGAQVMLAESSVGNQVRKLTDAVEEIMSSATKTEASVRGISTEMTTLANQFNKGVGEFSAAVVGELETVSKTANTTLENTRTAASAFSESVRAMATGVRETLMEMNTAHTQLSSQSENLIKMSEKTTAQLQPLSELIERYYAALPELASGSAEMGANLEQIVAGLTDKINQMRETVADSMTNISESSTKIEDLAGQSRQQMIDLMSDYSKAVDTMQTLNKQMMVARATAPMDAIKAAPAPTYAPISSRDFIAQSDRAIQKLHEQSMDLTRAVGAEIPDVVWKKYHAGDTTIFSKWLAKMLNAADKKQVRDLLKSDSVFRSQAAQFTRGFAKVLSAATQTDAPDATRATLLKTDLGQIYTALRGNNV